MERDAESSVLTNSWADKLAFALLIASVVLVPLVFSPNNVTLAAALKRSLFIILAGGPFVFWIIARLRSQVYTLPRSTILGASSLVWLVTLVSTLFSSARFASAFGSPLDIITLGSLTGGVLFLFLASIYFRPLSRVALFYAVLFTISIPIFFTQIFNIALLGSWSDLGIFFALICLLSIIFLEYSPQVPFLRLLGLVGGVLSLIAVIFVNIGLVSIVLLVSVLLVAIYKFVTSAGTIKQKFPAISIVALVLLAFTLVGGREGGFLLPSLNMVAPAPLSVRPSLLTTVGVTRAAFSADPILGVGPNLFSREWVKHKPLEVNQTQFWGVDFTAGSGFVPTLVMETGLLGLLAWILFLLAIILSGISVIKHSGSRSLLTTYTLASLLGTCLLWAMQVLFVTGFALLALSFIITGIFIACCHYMREVPDISLSTQNRPRLRSIVSIVGILFVLASLWVGYVVANEYMAIRVFAAALSAGNKGDIETATAKTENAISFDRQDVYYRTLAELELSALERSNAANQQNPELLQQNFVILYNKAIAAALEAVSIDPTNYLNHLSLATVYADVVNLKIAGAYEQAKISYEKAATLNPTNPLMPLALARLEVANGTPKGSVPYLNAALSLKQNYAPAFLLASQISAAGGDLETAIKTSDWATQAAPDDFTAFFQLGYLRYQNGEYKLAIEALERSVTLNPNYANAKYFLGLAYYQTGKRALSVEQFKDLLLLNPGNAQVTAIIDNLNSGHGPFDRVLAP